MDTQATIEYPAKASSPNVNGDVKLTIGDRSLLVTSVFDVIEVPYSTIDSIATGDYTVTIASDSGVYSFSRMGSLLDPFHAAVYGAYNSAVLRSLFVAGKPSVFATGDVEVNENQPLGAPPQEAAFFTSAKTPVQVYGDCVVSLPPDTNARRAPLCFVSGLDKSGYGLTLLLDTGERYSYTRLGYDAAPIADAAERGIRAIRDRTLAAVIDIDPSLPAEQASMLARLIPSGVAAPFGRLKAIAPSFTAAVETKLADTSASETFGALKTLCSADDIYVGLRRNEAADAAEPAEPAEQAEPGAAVPDAVVPDAAVPGAPDPYTLWLIAPSPDGSSATVEFAVKDSATFVYKTNGDFAGFASRLNRALEAISFKREAIRLTDEELRKPEYERYYMASKRTAALRFVRSCFAGRVIHAGIDAWQRKLLELWNAICYT